MDLGPELCGENGLYPEEFWNCADISITPGEAFSLLREVVGQELGIIRGRDCSILFQPYSSGDGCRRLGTGGRRNGGRSRS